MKIGILGYGNMGSAIAGRLKDKHQLYIFDKDAGKANNVSIATIAVSIPDLLDKSEVVILAVKPQDFAPVLIEIKKNIGQQLFVSIAAGITTAGIETLLGEAKVVRAMPNLPVKAGKGMTCLARGKYASEINLSFAREIFDLTGKTLVVGENMMNAVTAISGSGPGFLYEFLSHLPAAEWDKFIQERFIPAFSGAARKVGFSDGQARLLAETTAYGSLALLKESQSPPEVLRRQVTSKGGTTEAGLAILDGKIENLESAVRAALKRA
ncbi:MAG: pyrroline-5-carboxylate reductase, partial [Candidatus Omnitrophota bacterium]